MLTAERAGVFGVLGDFNLLDLLTGRATVAGSVLADYSDLLGVLGLHFQMDGLVSYGSCLPFSRPYFTNRPRSNFLLCLQLLHLIYEVDVNRAKTPS